MSYVLRSSVEAAQNLAVFRSGPLISAVIALCLTVQACVPETVGGVAVSAPSHHDKNCYVFMNLHPRARL